VGFHEVRVALHVHSRYSDGSGSVEAIVRAARDLVDVVWLTDHDGLLARDSPGEGRYGRVMLLVGTEMTPATDHILVLGTDFVPDRDRPLQEALALVAAGGGLSFVAHPEDPGNPVLHLPSYRWTQRDLDTFTGLEVWNHLSQWMRKIHGFRSGLGAILHPLSGADAPDPAALQLWDALACERPVVGVAGLDAHAVRVPWRGFGVPIFPYRSAFSWIANHVWTTAPMSDSSPAEARRLLLEAFAAGRVVMVNESQGRSPGPWVTGIGASDSVPVGGRVRWRPGARLVVESSVAARVEAVRQGWRSGPYGIRPGRPLEIAVPAPGAMRLELAREDRGRRTPWAYTNPIYFHD
jgi:hypothetical protein